LRKKELLVHTSLALNPVNFHSVKNYAFYLEWHGKDKRAHSLLEEAIYLTGDIGLVIQHSFIAYTYLFDEIQSLQGYYLLMKKAATALKHIPFISLNDPYNEIREAQLNMQYLGISSGILSKVYCKVIRHFYPNLQNFYELDSTSDKTSIKIKPNNEMALDSVVPIRFGIVAEAESNSSPGICLTVSSTRYK
jgi:hypothetical protein